MHFFKVSFLIDPKFASTLFSKAFEVNEYGNKIYSHEKIYDFSDNFNPYLAFTICEIYTNLIMNSY